MFRKKGFSALAGLLSVAMLTVGLSTGISQIAQAAEPSVQKPAVSATSTDSNVVAPVVAPTPVVTPVVDAPVVTPVDAKSAFGKTFSFKPSVTGAAIDFASTCLTDPSDGACKKAVVVAGEGTWRVTNLGWASFTPQRDFTGTTTAVSYQVANKSGSIGSASATVTVLAPAAPSVRAVFEITDYNTSILVTPEVTGESIDLSKSCLVDPIDGTCKSSVTSAEGTWTVRESDGSVNFAPAATFAGTTQSVEYRAFNTLKDFGKAGIKVHVNRPVASAPIVASGAGDVTALVVPKLIYGTDPASTGDGSTKRTSDSPLTTYTLTATPNAGSKFIHWTCTPELSTFTNPVITDTFQVKVADLTGDTTCNALFHIVVNFSAGSNGSVTNSGDNYVQYGTPISSVASASTGYEFDAWSCTPIGSPAYATGSATLSITSVTESVDCKATFKATKLHVTFNADTHGTVTPSGQQTVDYNGTISADASPDSGYAFNGWTCDPSSYGPPTFDPTVTPVDVSVTVSNVIVDVTCTAHFVVITWTVTFLVDGPEGSGQVTNPGPNSVTEGTNISSTASANGGYYFNGWTCDFAPDTANLTIDLTNVTQDITCTAHFLVIPEPPVVQHKEVETEYQTEVEIYPVVTGTEIQWNLACLISGDSCVKEITDERGTFTVLDNGSVTFLPSETFAGETATVTYQATDRWLQTGTGTLSVFVKLPAKPEVYIANVTTPYNEPINTALDVVATLVQPTQACLVITGDCVRKLVVAGKGTFTVLDDGSVQFDPLSTFAGGSVTVTYRAFDLWSQFGDNTLTVNVSLPDRPVVDISSVTVEYNVPADLTPTVHGTKIQPSKACVVSGATCGAELVIPSKGTFVVHEDGSVTFTPLATFAGGSATAVYKAFDLWNQEGENTVTVKVLLPEPPVVDVTKVTVDYYTMASATPGVVGTLIQNDQACFVDGDNCRSELFIEGKGTFTAYADGSITFLPLETFAGDVASATYRAFDLWGQYSENAVEVTVLLPAAPTVDPDSKTVDYGVTADLAPFYTGTLIQKDQACFVVENGCVRELYIEAKGTFLVLEDGTVTFTPLPTFADGTAEATYRVLDLWGQFADTMVSATVLLPAVPTVEAAVDTVDYNVVSFVSPVITGEQIQPLQACFVTGAFCNRDLIIEGKGTFSVLDDGTVTFTPLATFADGVASAVYRTFDLWGQSGENTIDVTVLLPAPPIVDFTYVNVDYNTSPPVFPDVTAKQIQPQKACLVDSNGDCVDTIVIDGAGTLTVQSTGSVTFVPLETFAGQSVTALYRATDLWGQTGENTVEIFLELPASPVVDYTPIDTNYNTDVTFLPVVDGKQVQAGGACLVSGNTCNKELVVVGQGTFTVNEDDTVTFVPVDTFAGAYALATYRVVDLWGQTGENTIEVYVALPAIPVVHVDDQTTDYNTGITFNLHTTGTKIQHQRACLVAGFSCGSEAIVDGQGTFTLLDDETIKFTPLDTFAKDFATVTYLAYDLWGQIGEKLVRVYVLPPAAPTVHSASTTVNYKQDATLSPAVTGTKIQPGWACLVDGDGNCVQELLVENKGNFKVREDGKVDFTPLDTFAGGTAVATYRGYDLWHQEDQNVLSVTVRLPNSPVVEMAHATIDYQTSIILTPVVTGTKIQYEKACLVSGSECVNEVIVPNKGTFTIVGEGGVNFTPFDTFAGGDAWVTYRAYDLWEQWDQNTVKVTVASVGAPNVDTLRATTDYNTPITVTPTVDSNNINVGRDCLVTREGCLKTHFIDGKGTFNVNSDGTVTFVPLDTFAGGTVCTTYRVYDMWGQYGQSQICITVLPPAEPVVDPREITIPYNTARDVTPNYVAYKPTSDKFCIVSGLNCYRTLTVRGKGTFVVDINGVLTFTPLSTFSNASVVVTFRVYDMWGQFGENDVKVNVSLPGGPVVHSSEVTADYMTTARVKPEVTGFNIQDNLACLVVTVNSVVSCDKELTIPGKGTFKVLDDGFVEFAPVDTFGGDSVTATYRATDGLGQTDENTVLVNIRRPARPVVTGDSVTVDYNTVATLHPSVTGTKVLMATACIENDGPPCEKTLVIANQGTFNVLNDGSVTFTPLSTFQGVVTGIFGYCVLDLFNQQACGSLSVTVREPAALSVAPKTVATPFNTPVSFTPTITGQAIDYSTACLVDPGDSQCKPTVSVADVGTWNVNTSNGQVTFTPTTGYEGSAVIEYRISNIFGRESRANMTTVVSGTATLNGVVWLDINKNGLQDADEPVLPGVLVTAGSTQPAGFGAAAANSYSVRTDSLGRYSFNVVAGTYEVKAFLNSSLVYTGLAKDPVSKLVESTPTWVYTTSVAGNTTNSTNFAARGNGEMSGSAVFTSGIVVPKATVSCLWSGFDGVLGTSDDVVIRTTADSNGAFTLSGVPGGKFECGGADPKSGTQATKAVVTVAGTSSPTVKPPVTKVVLPIKLGGGMFTFTVSNFVPGSPVITKAIKARITYFVKKYKQATQVRVEGFTQGPTVLKVDFKLSLDRAKNALAVVKALNTKILGLSVRNKQDVNHVGDNVRRVQITLYW